MPANTKYLTQSGGQRALKVSAAILGSYLVTVSFHLALAAWLDKATVMMTSAFSGFVLWAALMIVAFLARSGWRIWGVYVALTLLFLFATWGGIQFDL